MQKHTDISSLNRYNNRSLLIENKISFAGPESELSIYDTYRQADRVGLSSDQVMFCGMINGKKIMHSPDNNQSQVFLPHESYIIKPKGFVEIDFPVAQEDNPTTCLTIEISKDRINQISEKMHNYLPTMIDGQNQEYIADNMHMRHTTDTQKLLKRLVNLYTHNNPDKEILVNYGISELVTKLLRRQSRNLLLNYSKHMPDANSMTAVIDYLRSDITKPFDIDKLCLKACMSRSALYVEFKNQLGCTPSNYYWQLRLQTALEMLQNGKTVTTACYSAGFKDPAHFCRRFTQLYGCSPSQYQKE